MWISFIRWTCSSLLPISSGLSSQWAFTRSKVSPQPVPLQRGPATCFFPRPPGSRFSKFVSSKSLTNQTMNASWIRVDLYLWLSLYPEKKKQKQKMSRQALEVPSPGRISLYHCLLGPILSGTAVLWLRIAVCTQNSKPINSLVNHARSLSSLGSCSLEYPMR